MNINYGERALLLNYSTCYIERFIILDNPKFKDEETVNSFIASINKTLNRCIQELNIKIEGRTLPFMKVKKIIKEQDKIRIIISSLDSNNLLRDLDELDDFDIKKTSFLIKFIKLGPQRIITGSKERDINAEMLMDLESQVAAAVDIFLDIAMFHSYSFLDNMDLSAKKQFNKSKYEYFLNHNLNSYYRIEENSSPKFLSLAFAARTDIKKINLDKYVQLWNDLIEELYPSAIHAMPTPMEQIKKHRDLEMIDKRYSNERFWKKYSKGDYLLLRINRAPRMNKRKQQIADYFGIPKFHLGAIKIVPCHEYFNPFIKKQIDEHYVSAFKIVVT